MKILKEIKAAREEGAIGWILLWLIGIPLPILLIFFLLRGCT
jgi:hypothetical protein